MEEWKYGYVNDKEVVVFNDASYSFRVLGGHFLESVKLKIEENGTLRITGTEICHDLYTHRTKESDWENEPEESEV